MTNLRDWWLPVVCSTLIALQPMLQPSTAALDTTPLSEGAGQGGIAAPITTMTGCCTKVRFDSGPLLEFTMKLTQERG